MATPRRCCGRCRHLEARPAKPAGLTVLRETLTGLSVDPALYRAFDGSGLSRYDMVSPEALVQLLTAVWNDPALVGPVPQCAAGRGGRRVAREPDEGHAR